jgi:hypothetical protein
MKTVDEFEAQRDQERDKEQEKRQVTFNFRAGGIDIGIDAVGHEQDGGGDHAQEQDSGQRIEALVEIGPTPCRLDRAG